MKKLILLLVLLLSTINIAQAEQATVCVQYNSANNCTKWMTPTQAKAWTKQYYTERGHGDFYDKLQDYYNKPLTPQEKAKQEAQRRAEEAKIEADKKACIAEEIAYKKANIPNSFLIKNTLSNLNEEASKLVAKSNAGVDVSKNLELVNFKIIELQKLSSDANSLDESLSANKENLKNETITQSEYETIRSKIKSEDAGLIIPYQKIISVTSQNLAETKMAIEKARVAEEARIQKEAKKQEKIRAGRNLLDYGSGFLPASVNNYMQQGANVYSILGK